MFWYDKNGSDKDVFVSSRVRLARNLKDYPFDGVLCETGAREIIEKVEKALTPCGFKKLEINQGLCEGRIISRELAAKKTPCALLSHEETDTYVMVCEEDHIRLQCVKSGFDLRGALGDALRWDDVIDENCTIAFDEKLGYLTHCPTNLGTGMRASVMMFLPALTAAGRIRSLENQLGKLGFTIRGCEGEGSDARGDLYQISNSASLGLTEEEIIEKLESCARSIAESERETRQRLMEARGDVMRDKIMRSLGISRHAYMIDTRELYSLYSDIRLGISLGIIEKDLSAIDRALTACLPYNLTGGKDLSPAERDKIRAKKFAEALG